MSIVSSCNLLQTISHTMVITTGRNMGMPYVPLFHPLWQISTWKKGKRGLRYPILTHLSHWFRYGNEACVKIKSQDRPQFTDHITSVDQRIKLTRENIKSGRLAFWDWEISNSNQEHLKAEVYRKPLHTDQCLRFYCHHLLEHKLCVIRTLQYRANTSQQTQWAEK